jgi:hypothetical protein
MDTQLAIKFPVPESTQLTISETETSIAVRISYKVPEFTKTGMLTGYRLEHRVVSNLVSEEDFEGYFKHSSEKLLADADMIEGSKVAYAKKFNLTAEQAKLLKYTGYSICRHRTCTKVDAHDPRWV